MNGHTGCTTGGDGSLVLPALAALTIATASLTTGCDDSVTGNLTVNDQPFAPADCRTGEDREFFGVDLRDDSGKTVRLVMEADNTATVILIPSEGSGSVTFKGCAVISLDRSDNDKYGNYTIDGSADIRCDERGFRVFGTVQFDRCSEDY